MQVTCVSFYICLNMNYITIQAVFEKELGWVFWAWKVDDVAKKDISAPLWSYSLAVETGYFPQDLNKEADVTLACDHPVDMSTIILPPIQP